jgi:hypothetical protein
VSSACHALTTRAAKQSPQWGLSFFLPPYLLICTAFMIKVGSQDIKESLKIFDSAISRFRYQSPFKPGIRESNLQRYSAGYYSPQLLLVSLDLKNTLGRPSIGVD